MAPCKNHHFHATFNQKYDEVTYRHHVWKVTWHRNTMDVTRQPLPYFIILNPSILLQQIIIEYIQPYS